MCLMCVIRSVPARAGAMFVVSDKGDILSPKYAPDRTAPATIGNGNPRPAPTPIRATPIVPVVPQLVPVASDVSAQMIRVAGRKIEGDRMVNP